MKLSDIKGERTLDVIAEIIDPIANIASDKIVSELFARKKLPDGLTPKEFAVRRLKAGLPALIKGHKADLIAIFAALEGVSTEEYASNLNMVKLVKDCTDVLTDEAFTELFISAQTESSSGSAQETTAAPVA